MKEFSQSVSFVLNRDEICLLVQFWYLLWERLADSPARASSPFCSYFEIENKPIINS